MGFMARALRIEYAGAAYHLRARGNQGQGIFQDDADRRSFLLTLGAGNQPHEAASGAKARAVRAQVTEVEMKGKTEGDQMS